MYGAMAVDNDGAGLCSTGFDHGDAEHVGDFIPSRPGLEFFMCNEDGSHPAYHIRDARTCAIIQPGPINGADTGRCVAGDISASNPGARDVGVERRRAVLGDHQRQPRAASRGRRTS